MSEGQHLRLLSTGAYLPKQRVSNDELRERYQLETTDQWIFERSGISFRRLAGEGETTAFMAASSAEQALADAGCKGSDLDLIILATCTPDRSLPSAAIEVHRQLGCRSDCPAFDLAAACSGFVYALSAADSMMASGPQGRKALVVCAERMSSIVDWSDRSTAVLFGDGAAAVLLESGHEPGHYLSRLYADGSHADLLNTTHDGDKLVMQGRAVFRHAVAMMEQLVDELLSDAGLSGGDIDRLVPHQANSRIIKAVASKLGLSDEQVVMNIAEMGNTSAASIPIALDSGLRNGQIKQGHLVLFEAFGAGFVWGGSLMRV